MKTPAGGQLRLLLLTFLAVHFIRIFFIPFLARISGNEEYTETDKVVRALGYRLTGPCTLPRPLRNCSVEERIHVILVSAQWDRESFTEDETEVVIKSILSSTRCKLFFHFMVSGEMEEWGLAAMMEALGATPFDSVGPVAPKLVRHDTHVRAEELSFDLNEGDEVDNDPAVGYTIHPIPVKWVRDQLIMDAFGDQRAMDVWGFRPGDQWVWTMMCMNNPEKCRTLPKIWNVSGCAKPRFLGLNARDRDQNGTCWKVAHFNCMGVRDKQYYALINSDWDDTIQTIRNIPWSTLRDRRLPVETPTENLREPLDGCGC